MVQKTKVIDLKRGFIPTDPNAFPENLLGTKQEDLPEDLVNIVPFEGYNFLPTEYGYRSYFGTNSTINIAGLTSRCSELLMFQSDVYVNLLVALCEDGIWTSNPATVAGTWTHVYTTTYDPAIFEMWTFCIINNVGYFYQQAGSLVYKLTTAHVWSTFTPSFLTMAGQKGIFRAGGRLGFWDTANSVSWSSALDFTDLTPSLTTTADNTTFRDVIGNIVMILPQGDGFVIYATKSIVGVTLNSGGAASLWSANPVSNSTGIAYPTHVCLGNSDATHFAYTTTGLYAVGVYNALNKAHAFSPILTDVIDFIRESVQPVRLFMSEGRYLFISLIENDYIDGVFSSTTNTIPDAYFTVTGAPSVGTQRDTLVGQDALSQGFMYSLEAGVVYLGNLSGGTYTYPLGITKNGTVYGAADRTDSPIACAFIYTRSAGLIDIHEPVQDAVSTIPYRSVVTSIHEAQVDMLDATVTWQTVVANLQAMILEVTSSMADLTIITALQVVLSNIYDDASYQVEIPNIQPLLLAIIEDIAYKSILVDMSDDGQTGVGYCYRGLGATGYTLFRYTVAGGVTSLGVTTTYMPMISNDGGMIVGVMYDTATPPVLQGFIYTELTGLSLLGVGIHPTAISNTGSYICGNNTNTGGVFRYTTATGVSEDLGTVDLGGSYYTTHISNDGGVIVGSVTLATVFPASFIWTVDTGMITIMGVNAKLSEDGSTVTGYVTATGTCFLYTIAAGLVDLGPLGDGSSAPWGISYDGTMISGVYQLLPTMNPRVFTYTVAGGLVDVGTVTEGLMPIARAMFYDIPVVDDLSITVPGVTFNLGVGTPAPIYPTYAGAFVLDIQLKKWGKYKGNHKLIADYNPQNSNLNGAISYTNFGIRSGSLLTNGTISLFDNAPTDSWIRYGKIGFYREGFTNLREVRVHFRTLSTGNIITDSSYDGRSLEPALQTTTAFSGVKSVIAYSDYAARWHTVKISGKYDLQYLEVRGTISGKR